VGGALRKTDGPSAPVERPKLSAEKLQSFGGFGGNGASKSLDVAACIRVIGGVLVGLLGVTDEEALRRAVRFWAENDDAWDTMGKPKRDKV
jgi:hypothetical protein